MGLRFFVHLLLLTLLFNGITSGTLHRSPPLPPPPAGNLLFAQAGTSNSSRPPPPPRPPAGTFDDNSLSGQVGQSFPAGNSASGQAHPPHPPPPTPTPTPTPSPPPSPSPPPPPPPPPPPTPTSPPPRAGDQAADNASSGKSNKLKIVLAVTLSILFLMVGLLFLALVYRRKNGIWAARRLTRRRTSSSLGPFTFHTNSTSWVAEIKDATSVPVVIFDKPLSKFTFNDLLSATNNFERHLLLSEGRLGLVYRGTLPGDVHITAKVLVQGSSTLTDEEAAAELERVGRIKHPNLVPLAGYCLAGRQKIVIYEYMTNGNLHNLLHDLPLGVQTEHRINGIREEDLNRVHTIFEGHCTWRFRHKIALGVARALAFLHHGCSSQIVHRDVKASTIFLDPEFEPRLSDFGLENIVGSSIVYEIERGSPGYSPPELSDSETTTSATPESDVYEFGVVLLELITGKKPIGDEYPDVKETSLVCWVRGLMKTEELSKAIDPKIRDTGPEDQMLEALRIGYLCTADKPLKRPSMQQIVGLLKDIVGLLKDIEPADLDVEEEICF